MNRTPIDEEFNSWSCIVIGINSIPNENLNVRDFFQSVRHRDQLATAWCETNCRHDFWNGRYENEPDQGLIGMFYFEDKDDAMLFRLTWGGG